MSFKLNFSSILAAAAGAVIFTGAAMAQDTTTVTPNTGDKAERHHRGDHGEKGDRKGGRGEFGGRHHGMGKMGGGMMFHDLNLTDAQKAQIKQIHEANKGNRADFEAIKPLMEAKRNGTLTDDQKAQLKAFRDQRQAKAKQIHEQMLAVLTAEQKALLDQKRTEMKAKREQFRQERQNRRQQKQNGEVTVKPAN